MKFWIARSTFALLKEPAASTSKDIELLYTNPYYRNWRPSKGLGLSIFVNVTLFKDLDSRHAYIHDEFRSAMRQIYVKIQLEIYKSVRFWKDLSGLQSKGCKRYFEVYLLFCLLSLPSDFGKPPLTLMNPPIPPSLALYLLSLAPPVCTSCLLHNRWGKTREMCRNFNYVK